MQHDRQPLLERIDALQDAQGRISHEIAALRRRIVDEGLPVRAEAAPARTGRRGLLRVAAAIAAGAAGSAVLGPARPVPASANNGDVMHVAGTYTATGATAIVTQFARQPGIYGFGVTEGLNSSPGSGALLGHNKGTYDAGVFGYDATPANDPIDSAGVYGLAGGRGAGVRGRSERGAGVSGASAIGDGVSGHSDSQGSFGVRATSTQNTALFAGIAEQANTKDAIFALTNGSGRALFAVSALGSAIAGQIARAASTADAVVGETAGPGAGVRGTSASGNGVFGISTAQTGVVGSSGSGSGVAGSSGSGTGVYGTSTNGGGVFGEVKKTTNNKAAVRGKTFGPGPGVQGQSALGRGGVFGGKAAQLRLIPRPRRPTSGLTGDFFVDATGRLWYCRAGGTKAKWVQLA